MYAFRQNTAESDTAVATMPAPSHVTAASRYRKEDSLNLSPVQVIARVYDVAILALKKDDKELARRAVNELISALNFDYQEVSLGLYRLYDYCKTMIRQGKNDEAMAVLTELRSAWVEAFKL